MRVYLPSTLAALADLQSRGGLGPGPHEAYAVTPRLREWYVAGDLEELEYAALSQAAHASLQRLAEDPDTARRRVVIAAEVPDPAVTNQPDGAHARVIVAGPVPLDTVAAIHVDEEAAVPTIAAAVDALAEAEAGDDDAAFTVDQAGGFELLWYAAQEISDLLA